LQQKAELMNRNNGKTKLVLQPLFLTTQLNSCHTRGRN